TTGAVIPVTVTFSDIVNVTGTPQLTLETGTTDQVADYASGSGTATLTFNYIVQAGDTSPDLDYISASALVLSGGTIKDAAGHNADLTLPAPGTAGSLGANKAIEIDTAAPSVTINQAKGQADPTSSTPVNFQVVFSEAVTGFSNTGITLSGTANPTTAVVTGGPTSYTIAVSGMTASGTVIASIPANVASDAAGNANVASTSTDNTVTYVNSAPPVITE